MRQGVELPEKRRRCQHPNGTKEHSSTFPLSPRKNRAQARSQVWGEKSPPSRTVMAGCMAWPGGWVGTAKGHLLNRPETCLPTAGGRGGHRTAGERNKGTWPSPAVGAPLPPSQAHQSPRWSPPTKTLCSTLSGGTPCFAPQSWCIRGQKTVFYAP